MGKTDERMHDGAQGKGDGVERRLEMHDNRPGMGQEVVVMNALASQWVERVEQETMQ